MLKYISLLILCVAMVGCSHGTPRGVDVTITQGANQWQACSLAVWHHYAYETDAESSVLHFTDSNGQTHELAGQYRVDYSKTVCY